LKIQSSERKSKKSFDGQQPGQSYIIDVQEHTLDLSDNVYDIGGFFSNYNLTVFDIVDDSVNVEFFNDGTNRTTAQILLFVHDDLMTH
jgi:hypothetical protein